MGSLLSIKSTVDLEDLISRGELTEDAAWAAASAGHEICLERFKGQSPSLDLRSIVPYVPKDQREVLARTVALLSLKYCDPSSSRFFASDFASDIGRAKGIIQKLAIGCTPSQCLGFFEDMNHTDVTFLGDRSDVWHAQMTTVAFCALVHGGHEKPSE